MGPARPHQSRFRNHRRADLSNREVRARPRQGLHARRCGRRARGVRSWPPAGGRRAKPRRGGGYGGAHPVSATPDPAASFEPYRRRLLGLAYRMLGSMADAEDAVQETYLRWHAADREKVCDPRAFLMTTTTRICLDFLTSARVRREEYVGPWLPEPIVDTAELAPDTHT